MKRIVVLSGKGGTGKTSIVAALAARAARELRLVLVDADADAANLGLLLAPTLDDRLPFFGSDVAVVDPERCLACGGCMSVCRPRAIRIDSGTGRARVDPIACEGCGACVLECPFEAVSLEPCQAGWERHHTTVCGRLFDGDLLPGQENSGKLVAVLRQAAEGAAERADADWLLVDGPPGIGCPVIAAATGTDLALLVTEPSLSALHDLERILQTVRHFGIPALAVLNKADLHGGVADRIRRFLAQADVPLIASIPFLDVAQEAVEAGRPLLGAGEPELDAAFEKIFDATREALAASRTASAAR